MSDHEADAAPSAPDPDGASVDPPRPVLAAGLVEAAAGAPPELAVAAADAPPPPEAETESGATPPIPDEPAVAGPVDATGSAAIDVADPDAEALSAVPLGTRIEALLFAAAEPLPLRRLKELTACPDAKAVRDAVDALSQDYATTGRAFRIEEVAQGFQLRTGGHVSAVVARLGRRPAEERLSTAALETLAVIAYRQPVLRADIEKIRGVACGEVLRALQERGLVRIAGRADLPGSPLLYGSTQRFLEVFGLRDLQELPKDRELLRPRE